ncbi:MAG: CHASE2 domain-containing protein, partial [Nitrospirota bacterium]|nr:CHASE2 domain-containing protein [Nitrospirota bacterium]
MDYRSLVRPFTIGAALATLVLLIYYLNPLNLPQFLELKGLDLRFQLRGAIPPNLPIVLISIDEDSFDEINLPWPWPRDLHARLVRKLTESQVKLIGLDILFVQPKADSREDLALAEAINEAGNVILGAVYTEV